MLEPEAYSESYQTSKMESFAKIVNGKTIITKRSILRQASEYASENSASAVQSFITVCRVNNP